MLGAALESKRAINLSRIGQFDAWLHQIRGDYQEALEAAERCARGREGIHIDWAIVNCRFTRGWRWRT